MRLDIRYRTRFAYTAPVRESANELRACPTNDHRQQLVSYRVATSPPARVMSSLDYWGTRVDAFGVREPHDHLEVVAESVVETVPGRAWMASPTLSEVRAPEFCEEFAEYLQPSPHVQWDGGVSGTARARLENAGEDATSVVLSLHRFVGTTLRYTPGATYVGVNIEQVLARQEGVCQDFAHLLLALCRAAGFPARYVSGYLFASDDSTGAEVEGDMVLVQTHAWVEVALPGGGWLALDPTNRQEVGERHVKIGHGRDYDDVTPLRGAYSGVAEHQLDVAVEIRRSAQQQQQQ